MSVHAVTLTPAERILSGAIRLTWAFYALGALYIVGPVLGWSLVALVFLGNYLRPALPDTWHARTIPFGAWVWIGAMSIMLVALIVAHANFELGLAKTVKSTIGWAKGWALLAIFPLAGACLPIRSAVIYRAMCHVGLQTLLLLPVLMASAFTGLPEALFVSPLKAVGGPGPEFFTVQLYITDPSNGEPRWQFYTPWAPAAGMMGVVMLLCALEERDWRWSACGILGALAMIFLSKSRMALVAFAIIWPASHLGARLFSPALWCSGALGALIAGLGANTLLRQASQFIETFKAARADSTRVREALGRIAVDRWWNEAPVFGHGVVERGPHLVEYMPIGSHHSWYGLLFVKGLVGAMALAVPIAVNFVECLVRAQVEPAARVGIAVLSVMLLYSFGENLEILVYLFWPASVLLGVALRPPGTDTSGCSGRVSSRRPYPRSA
ncbi:MAG: O-antigen ligase domain-containing protein [Pseudomonadota bacterium]